MAKDNKKKTKEIQPKTIETSVNLHKALHAMYVENFELIL